MGAKFKIEEDPTFSVKVGLDRAGGEKIEVLFTFNYFAQDELSLMQEEWQNRRDYAVEEAKSRIKTGPEWDELRRGFEVKELSEIIVGWEFDNEYNEDNLRKLLNSMRSHYSNILTAFGNGLNPARFGKLKKVVAAFYERGISDDHFELMGFESGDLDTESTPVFKDCWQSLVVFDQLSTQWRVGNHATIGLDYNVIPHVFRMAGIKRKDQPAIFSDIRVMENEALNIINAKE